MRHLRPVLLSSLLLISAVASAGKSRGYSLTQLSAAANVLRVAIDEGSFCTLKAEEAKSLIQPLHALLDQKVKKIEKPKDYLKQHSDCERNCQCGLAVDILEQIPTEKMTAQEMTDFSEIQAKASRFTSKQAVTCARKNVWFCKSALLQELRAQVR